MIIQIIGLPGSGKTWLAEALKECLQKFSYITFTSVFGIESNGEESNCFIWA